MIGQITLLGMEPFWAVVLVIVVVAAILVLLQLFGFDLEKLWLLIPSALVVLIPLSFLPWVGDFFHWLWRVTWIFGGTAMGIWMVYTCLTGGFDPWRRQ